MKKVFYTYYFLNYLVHFTENGAVQLLSSLKKTLQKIIKK